MDDTPERVALVTGATGGIGRATARRLGSLGWSVAVTGRDRERGRETVRAIEEAGGESQFFRADLADMGTVSALAESFRERYDRLDVLVNNAACSPGERRLTPYGHEMAFAVNHLAPYRLTHDLLGMLRESAPARVVNTSSTVHRRGEIDFDSVAHSATTSANGNAVSGDLRFDEGYEALAAYARSKLANLLFTIEFGKRLDSVTANAVHPGFVPGSGLYRDASLFVRAFAGLAARLPGVATSVEEASDGLFYAAVAPALADVSGAYFEGIERAEPDPRATDDRLRERLWNASAELVGIDPDWP